MARSGQREAGRHGALVLAVVLLVVCAATGLAGVVGGSPEMAPVSGKVPAGPGPAEPARIATAEPPERVTGSAEVSRRPALPERVTFTDWSGVSLLVVDGLTGRPVAGATVAVLDTGGPRRGIGLDLTEETERFGALQETGADGRIRLPAVEVEPKARGVPRGYLTMQGRPRHAITHFSVVAMVPGRYAHASIPAVRDEESRLVLRPDETLRVRVLSAAGAPVSGAGIALLAGVHEFGSLTPRGFTDETGTWVLRHLHEVDHRRFRDGAVTILLRALCNPIVAVPVVGRPVPVEPIVIRLPATGSLSITPVDHRGQPLQSVESLELDYDLPKHPVHGHLVQAARQKRMPDSASFEFPFVGLGLELYPTLHVPHPQWREHRRGVRRDIDGEPIRGPMAVGEHRRVDLPLPQDVTLIRATCLDADQRPLAPQALAAWKWERGRLASPVRVQVLEGGRIEWIIRIAHGSLSETVVLRSRQTDPEPVAVRIRMGHLEAGATHDLGELRLLPVEEDSSPRGDIELTSHPGNGK